MDNIIVLNTFFRCFLFFKGGFIMEDTKTKNALIFSDTKELYQKIDIDSRKKKIPLEINFYCGK